MEKYCPIGAWKKARKKGLSPYEQIIVGKQVNKVLQKCECGKKNERV